MEDFKMRLLLYVENLGQSVRAFEQECGLGNGTVASIRAKGPGAEVVSKIAYTHPDLNLNWLFRGTGEMLISESIQYSHQSPAPKIDIHHNQTVNIGNWGDLANMIVELIHKKQ
ncbi:MAG: hypothetical protein IJP77_11840 [Bacteroidales bacterium]|nr:hypothetical protein [Bacteroidales bacterium]